MKLRLAALAKRGTMGTMTVPPNELAARQLVENARAGDQTARTELLEPHLAGLRSFVRLRLGRRLRHRDTSLDLVQSVCREALEGLAGFEYRGPNSFRNWLLRQAENKIRDRGRFWSRERRRHEREAGPLTVELVNQLRTFCTPSRHASAREELALAEAAFERLPEDYRRVIVLSRIQNLPHATVARELGRTVAATRTLLSRALARLATLLEEPAPVSAPSRKKRRENR